MIKTKVKVIITNSYQDLEDLINLFLDNHENIHVKDIKYKVCIVNEDDAEISAMIIYVHKEVEYD